MQRLGRVDVCGLEYEIIEATEDEVPDLKNRDGLTVYQEGKIYLRATTNVTRKRDTLAHELKHAWQEASGLHEWLQAETGFKGKRWTDFEECLTRLETPAMVCALESARPIFDRLRPKRRNRK